MRKLPLILILLFSSCMFEEGRIDIIKLNGGGVKSTGRSTVTSVAIVSDQLVIDGANLDGVTNVRITGPSGFDQTFAIESQSGSSLVANGLSNIAFAVGSVFDLILTDAQGAATHQVTFTLQDGAVTAAKLHDMGAGVGQVLRYDGSTWGPGDLGALSYAGNWDASSATAPNVSPAAGEFYIVSVAGSTDLSGGTGTNSWAVGDWAVWNDVASQWEKVANGSSVTSFNGRSGPVTPATNDYTWAQIDKTTSPIGDLSNVNTTGAGVGSVLKFDGTNWVVGTDDTAGAGSVDSTAITDGSIVDADVNAAANIAQSKINNLTTDLAAKLNLSGGTMTGDLTVPNLITSGNVDGVDVSALNSTVGSNSAAIAGKQNTITTGSTAQYLRGDLSLSTFATDARSAAVLNSTAGSETDRAASVAAMKSYVAANAGSGDISDGGNSTGSTVIIGTNDAQSLQLETNNAPALTILNGGNVGIGTTNPESILDVRGDGHFQSIKGRDVTSGAAPGLTIAAGTTTTGLSSSSSQLVIKGPNAASVPFFGQTSGDGIIMYAGRRSAAVNHHGQNIFISAGEGAGTHSGSGDGVIRFATGLNERVRIDRVGNVGIGTNNPGTKLDVEGKITVGPIDATAGNTGAIALEELAANGTNSVSLRAPDALAANYVLTLPADDGTTGQVLTTDGFGVLSWTTAGAGGVTNVTASAPLASSGGATPNLTITQASGASNGYLSSTDWTTFNNKQAAITTGATTQYLRGDLTLATLQDDVRATLLTGFSSGAGTVAATDTILQAINKLDGNIAAKENAITAAAATTYFRGDKTFVTLDTAVVPENTNLYHTTGRARTAAVVNSTAGSETDQAASVAAMKSYVASSAGDNLGNHTAGQNLDMADFRIVNLDRGTAALPGLSFNGDAGTGLYSPGASTVSLSTAGEERIRFDFSGNASMGTTTVGHLVTNGHAHRRVFGIAGGGDNSGNSHGALYLGNNRATPNANDTTGLISFGSRNNANETVAEISSKMSGSGGADGFGGEIIFATKEDNVASVSESMRIDTSGNVGIGTANPAVELDVHTGTINAASICDENNANCLDLSAGVGGGGDIADGGNTTGSTVVIGTNDAQSLQFETNNSPAMTILNGGNVGIGTTTPSEELEVDGTIAATDGSTKAGLFSVGSTAYVGSTSNHTFSIVTNSTRKITVSSSGNVGIGTTIPLSKLEVEGKITVGPINATAGNTGAIELEELAANGTNSVTLRSPDALAADYTLTMPADDGTTGQVLTTDGSGVLSWTTAGAGSVTSVTASAPLASSGGATPNLTITQANGSTNGYLSSTDWTTFNSKQAAITTGTTAQYLRGDLSLSTFATDARTAAVLNSTAGSQTDQAASVAAMKSYVSANAGDIADGGNTTGATVVVGTNDAQSLQFETNNSPAMTILNGGNIGVGTTNPSKFLHIRGDDPDILLDFSATPSGDRAEIVFANNGTNMSRMTFNRTSEVLTIDADMDNNSTGNLILQAEGVGIGTTTANAKLVVDGAAINNGATADTNRTIDFSTSNLAYTTASCGSFTLQNMRDGGSYTLAVQGSSTNTCSFTASGFTVHMPTDHGAATASTHTLYTFLVMGTHIYVAWVPGL